MEGRGGIFAHRVVRPLADTESRKVRCGLQCMLNPEKLAEMSAQIASDLFQLMQVSRRLLCLPLTSRACHQAPRPGERRAATTETEGRGRKKGKEGSGLKNKRFCHFFLMRRLCLLAARTLKLRS